MKSMFKRLMQIGIIVRYGLAFDLEENRRYLRQRRVAEASRRKPIQRRFGALR